MYSVWTAFPRRRSGRRCRPLSCASAVSSTAVGAVDFPPGTSADRRNPGTSRVARPPTVRRRFPDTAIWSAWPAWTSARWSSSCRRTTSTTHRQWKIKNYYEFEHEICTCVLSVRALYFCRVNPLPVALLSLKPKIPLRVGVMLGGGFLK